MSLDIMTIIWMAITGVLIFHVWKLEDAVAKLEAAAKPPEEE